VLKENEMGIRAQLTQKFKWEETENKESDLKLPNELSEI
jgi:hypothetical protein